MASRYIIDDRAVLIQVVACCRIDDQPLPAPRMAEYFEACNGGGNKSSFHKFLYKEFFFILQKFVLD